MRLPLKILISILCFINSVDSFSSVIIGGSTDLRYEREMDQAFAFQGYGNLLALYRYDSFYFGAEYFQQANSSYTGQQTYSVKRLREGGFAEVFYQADDWGVLNPYISLGLGLYQDIVDTAFLGKVTQDTSRLYTSGFSGLGVKFDQILPLFLALEVRLIFAENIDPQPTVSSRAIVGWVF